MFCTGFGKDPSFFYSCGADGAVIKFITETQQPETKIITRGAVLRLSVKPDNDNVVLTCGYVFDFFVSWTQYLF